MKLAQVCVLCSETEIERQGEHYVLRGSPTENALVHMAISAGVDILRLREECPVLQVTHRAENRNFMSTLHGACFSINPVDLGQIVQHSLALDWERRCNINELASPVRQTLCHHLFKLSDPVL